MPDFVLFDLLFVRSLVALVPSPSSRLFRARDQQIRYSATAAAADAIGDAPFTRVAPSVLLAINPCGRPLLDARSRSLFGAAYVRALRVPPPPTAALPNVGGAPGSGIAGLFGGGPGGAGGAFGAFGLGGLVAPRTPHLYDSGAAAHNALLEEHLPQVRRGVGRSWLRGAERMAAWARACGDAGLGGSSALGEYVRTVASDCACVRKPTPSSSPMRSATPAASSGDRDARRRRLRQDRVRQAHDRVLLSRALGHDRGRGRRWKRRRG